MKLSELKKHLKAAEQIAFELPNGDLVPRYVHVTEVGKVSKHFIDCGGTVRLENKINLQLWHADDYDHRLHPEKLIHILELSEQKLELDDVEIEVEYQGETINRYDLEHNGTHFLLTNRATNCLAGVPEEVTYIKPQFDLGDMKARGGGCCAPGTC